MRKVKVNGKEVTVRSDRDTFARLLIVQKTRGIQLQEALQYGLPSLPLSLSDSFSLCKTAKSELFKYFKKINSSNSSYTI